MCREFVLWTVCANLIAWPLAYIIMSNWLRSFAYRTGFGLEPFFLSFLLSLTVSVAAIAYQSVRTALSNPVDSLRYE